MKAPVASVLSGLAILAVAVGQEVSTRYDPAVPTGTPIPAKYNGPLRPQIHYSPPVGFMNDPNGMFRDNNGTWHYYYQFNPTGLGPGNTHWGHATSQDLYHWENQPIALFPPADSRYASTFAFTGSSVVDTNNTSGFFPAQDNGVVAIFTLGTQLADGTGGPQSQYIAYSYDSGYTFALYDGNPVLDIGSDQFRDPKVIWYQDHWVMAIAYSHEFVVGFFTSPDLKNWTHASNFSRHGIIGTQYECPNLVSIPARDQYGNKVDDMWMITISAQPGAPLGGSITEYFPGYFNGTHFTEVDGIARLSDFAKDNYAGQYFYGVPEGEDAISIAWASNWAYTASTPSASEGWRSTTTLPRRQYLTNASRIGWTLVDAPYDLTPVLGDVLADECFKGDKGVSIDFSNITSNAIYWEANVTNINNTALGMFSTANFSFFAPNSGEAVRSGYFFTGDTPFWLDRGNTYGLERNPFFTNRFAAADITNGSYWSISGVMDRSQIEVFVDKGIHSATAVFFPNEPLTLFSATFKDLADAEVTMRVYALNSAWAQYEDANGTVVGNLTQSVGNYSTNSTVKRGFGYETRLF